MGYKKCYLIAPSGDIDKKNLELAISRSKEIGFEKAEYDKNIFSKYLTYAGVPQRRYNELNNAYSSETEVIFAVLGGQGSVHLLNDIDYNKIKNSNKILIGSSDITILLNSIYQKTGAKCFHGPNLGKDQEFHKKTLEYLNKALNEEDYVIEYEINDIIKKGKAEGKIIGGNIELLGRSLGTPYEINTNDAILFLEDYKMKPWRIFDILWQLKLSNKFVNIKGIILGSFLDCGEDINEYLLEFFKDFDFPIIMNQPIGHKEPNITIPLGSKCIIDTENLNWKISR